MREKAPFIWTSKQTVNPVGMLSIITEPPARTEEKHRWLFFRRNFELTSEVTQAELHITVDGRYQLFVNGSRIGRGPARCSPLYQRYDSYDIANYLRPGKNSIAVLVRVFGKDMSWYERTRGLWQPVFGDGGIWLHGKLTSADQTVELNTDLDWRCLESGAWMKDLPEPIPGVDFIEVLDARELPAGWTSPDFDDSDWDAVQVMDTGGGGPETFFGGLRSKPFPHLVENKLAPLAEDWVSPERIAWVKEALPAASTMLFYHQFYEEELTDLVDGSVSNINAAILGGTQKCRIKTANGKAISILLDFGRITTIYPALEMAAKGGEIIDIAVNERLPDEWDEHGAAATSRIGRADTRGLDSRFCRYIAKPGHQRFEKFAWQAAKWMQITVRNADEGLEICNIGGLYTRYPTEPRGQFECSDPMLTELWDTGRYTLQLCMHDGWEDCPSREQRQWLGDATVENLVGHVAFGPDVAPLNAEFLRKCAESQRPDGLTQMFAPGNHGTDGLLIPDWTLQWILNAGDHLRWTDDVDVIEEIFPSIQKALAWFERSRGASGLVTNMAYWHFIDWSGVGRSGEACTLNAQLAGCYKVAALMATALEMPRVACKYREIARDLCAALQQRHWDAQRGVYIDCVDPVTGAQGRRTSQHANAAMILWGEAPEDQWPSMTSWITDPARITFTSAPPIVKTGDPLDEETGVVMANTFYSHFVFEALAQTGHLDLALALIRDRYGSMIKRGATTLWESFGPTASLCHGFSATPTWQMSARILGVQRQTGGKSLRFSPNLVDLDYASGVVPILEGDVSVSLSKTDTGFTAAIAAPPGVDIDIVSPRGFIAATPTRDLQRNNTLTVAFSQT